MELSNKCVMVVGLGVSGLAAARFLASRGAKLVMTDRRSDVARDRLPSGALKLGADDASWLDGVELVVTSPGVPRDSVLLRTAVEKRIPVIGEIELASRFLKMPIAAITGTNGKSTVVVLLGEILKADDPNVWKLANSVRSRVIGFGLERGGNGASIWFDQPSNSIVYDFDFG